MNCLSLNIRGDGGVSKIRIPRELVIKESMEFVTLQETLISGDTSLIVNTIWSQGEFAFCQVPSNGRSGGLLSIWKKGCFDVVNAFAGDGFLCVEGRWNGASDLISIINVYAPQDHGKTKTLWLDICSYLTTASKLFCVMGDFNTVRKSEERMGEFHHRRAADFNAFIGATDLHEMHLGGRRFT